MKPLILNLLNANRSDIGYRTMTFNDGEPHIWIDDFDRKRTVDVRCRLASPTDLFLLMQVGDVLRRQGVVFSLFVTYLMGQRMDRVISYGEAFSLRVVAQCINAIGADSVTILEPHSDRAISEINRSKAVGGTGLHNGLVFDNDIIVHPDQGAADRYAQSGNFTNPIVTALKNRDPQNGRIRSLQLTADADDIIHRYRHTYKSFLAIDDLCDGGRTFALLAALLKERYPDYQRRIFVTHMVNENGIRTLSNNYDEVIFTNSYRDWQKQQLPANVKVIEVD